MWKEFCLSKEDAVTLPEDVADLLLDIDVITDDVILLDNDVITDDVILLDIDVITDNVILLDIDVITDDVILLDIDVITDDVILLDNDVIAVVIIDNVISLDNVITNDITLFDNDVIIVFTEFDGFVANGFVGNSFVGNSFGGDVISIDAVISLVLDFSDDAIVLAVFRRDVTSDVITYEVTISDDLGVIVDGETNEGFIADVLFGKEFVDRGIRSVELACP